MGLVVLRYKKMSGILIKYFFNIEATEVVITRRKKKIANKFYAAGLFNVSQRRSFNSVNPLLVKDEINK